MKFFRKKKIEQYLPAKTPIHAEDINKFGNFGFLPITKTEAALVNTSSLAFLGDAVYSLLVRERLSLCTDLSGNDLHKTAVGLVRAGAQAKSTKLVLPLLDEREQDIFMRGRNMQTSHKAKSSSDAEYHAATALETLFGYLYLSGQFERIYMLFEEAVSCDDSGFLTLKD